MCSDETRCQHGTALGRTCAMRCTDRRNRGRTGEASWFAAHADDPQGGGSGQAIRAWAEFEFQAGRLEDSMRPRRRPVCTDLVHEDRPVERRATSDCSECKLSRRNLDRGRSTIRQEIFPGMEAVRWCCCNLGFNRWDQDTRTCLRSREDRRRSEGGGQRSANTKNLVGVG